MVLILLGLEAEGDFQYDFAGELALRRKLSRSLGLKLDKSRIFGSPWFFSVKPVHYPDDIDSTSSEDML